MGKLEISENFVGEVLTRYKSNRRFYPLIGTLYDTEKFIRRTYSQGVIEHREIVGVIFLNNSKVLGYSIVSEGGILGAVVDVRLIFQKALGCNATRIILYHNHPSGTTKPSKADVDITLKLQKAGEVMDIHLIDSIIITKKDCVSIL